MRKALLITALLIVSASLAWASKKDLLLESTMGENISGFGNFGIQSRQSFDKTSREIMWFGHFKFLTANQAKLFIEWITPAGELFRKEQFTTQFSNCDYGWAKLDIRGKDAAALALEGEWTARVYWDSDLISTQKFYMGIKQYAKAPSPEPEVVVPDSIGTAEGYIRLAKAYYAKDEIGRAVDALLMAETVEPNSSSAYLILGSLYNSIGQSDDAILQFSKAQSLKADEVAVRRGFGIAYTKLNLTEDAIKEYEAILKIKPNSKEDVDKLNALKSMAEKPTPVSPTSK